MTGRSLLLTGKSVCNFGNGIMGGKTLGRLNDAMQIGVSRERNGAEEGGKWTTF